MLEDDHVITKINGKFYDVEGLYIEEDDTKIVEFTEKMHVRWNRNTWCLNAKRMMHKEEYYYKEESFKIEN